MPKVSLVFFRGCPNVEKARLLLNSVGIRNFSEIVQDDLQTGDPLKGLSSPSILKDGEIVIGQQCSISSGFCTLSPDDETIAKLKKALKEINALQAVAPSFLGSTVTLSLFALLGICSSGCALMAVPLAGLFASAGLGVLAPWLPIIRYPLLALSALLALISVIKLYRIGYPIRASVTGVLLGGMIAMSFTIRDTRCRETVQGTAKYLKSLSTETQDVVKNGIYRQWIALGRAPKVQEIETAFGSNGARKVVEAFQELRKSEFSDMFIPGSNSIRWFWPLSTIDHGVSVTLLGEKPVFARCAVDALGMSRMFGKPSTIEIRTPFYKKLIKFSMNGKELVESGSSVIVSEGNGCDDLLFFSSNEEFEQFKAKSGRDLKIMSLKDAVRWGLASFGSIFDS